jgi:ABC-type spermidine/putrescine transport system permease subunit II
VTVLALTVLTPLGALAASPKLFSGAVVSFTNGLEPFQWGVVTALLGATGAVLLGVGLALATQRAPRALKGLIEIAGLLALLLPAAVFCIGLARSFGRSDLLAPFYDSTAFFLAAYGLRYFYVPWKLAQLHLQAETRNILDTERMLGLGAFDRAKLALAGVLRPAAWGGGLVVFALAFGEIEIAIFRQQPGSLPLSIFLDNAMHTGRSATVIQWSLASVVLSLLVAWSVLKLGAAPWQRSNAVT